MRFLLEGRLKIVRSEYLNNQVAKGKKFNSITFYDINKFTSDHCEMVHQDRIFL